MTKSNDSDSIKIVLSKKEADHLYDILANIKAAKASFANYEVTIEQSRTSGIGPNTKVLWSLSGQYDLTDYSSW